MLKIIRKKGLIKKIMWVLAITIILSFGVLGSAYLLIGLKDSRNAGKIFGKNISIEEYAAAYKQTELFAKLRYADKFYEIQRDLALDSETWDRLILLNEANRRKINIPDSEVVKAIEQYPIFQRDNKFDSILYTAILRSSFLRTEPREFEENIRNNLRVAELIAQEIKSYQPKEREVEDLYRKQNEKIQVSYALIRPELFAESAQASDDEIKAYYEANKLGFMIPLSIKVDYVILDFPQPPPQSAEGETPAVDEAEKDAVRAKAIEIYEEFKTTPSLATLAQKHNFQLQSTPYFSQQQPLLTSALPLSLLLKMFKAENNVLAEPLEEQKGMILALVSDRRKSHTPELTEVQDKVREAVIQSKSWDIAMAKSQEYYKTIMETYDAASLKEFAKIAQGLGLEVEQTPLFTRGVYLPKIGMSGEFQEAAFALSEDNKISQPIKTATGIAILHLDKYDSADDAGFENQKERLIRLLVDQKTGQVYAELLAKLRIKANLKDNISRAKTNVQ